MFSEWVMASVSAPRTAGLDLLAGCAHELGIAVTLLLSSPGASMLVFEFRSGARLGSESPDYPHIWHFGSCGAAVSAQTGFYFG